MKLLNLFFNVFVWAANAIYYIIASPVIIPTEIYKWQVNKKWRKNIKADSDCFITLALSGKTKVHIVAISADKSKAFIRFHVSMYTTSQWVEIKRLYII
jgi:F0F1-type ATP synthase membrane subunit a